MMASPNPDSGLAARCRFLMGFVLAFCLQISAQPEYLSLTDSVEGTLGPGESQRFRVAVDDEPLLLVLEQHGVDLSSEVEVDGTAKMKVDAPAGAFGPEFVLVYKSSVITVTAQMVGKQGRFVVKQVPLSEFPEGAVAAFEAVSASILVGTELAARLDFLTRALGLWPPAFEQEAAWTGVYAASYASRLGKPEAAARFLTGAVPVLMRNGVPELTAALQNQLGLAFWQQGLFEEAVTAFNEALRLRSGLEDGRAEAETLNNLALVYQQWGRFSQAEGFYLRASALLQEAPEDPLNRILAINRAGLYQEQGRFSDARDLLTSLLGRQGSVLPAREAARVHNNLAFNFRRLGAFQSALDHYHHAELLFRKEGNLLWLARVTNNIGSTYMAFGANEEAVRSLEAALRLREEAGDQRGIGITLTNLGRCFQKLGAWREAEAVLVRAQRVYEEIEYGKGIDSVLRTRAELELARGDGSQALVFLDQVKSGRDDPVFLRLQGEAFLETGRLDEARGVSAGIPALVKARGDDFATMRGYFLMARLEGKLGDRRAALSFYEAAEDIIDNLRSELLAPDLRLAFQGETAAVFEAHMDFLLLSEPRAEASVLQALVLGERLRARVLRDLIAEAESGRTRDDHEVSERERLSERLVVLARQREWLVDKNRDTATVETELDRTLRRLNQLEAEVRAGKGSTTLSRSFDVDDLRALQSELGGETLILVYRLGEQQTFLSLVSQESVETRKRPGRERLLPDLEQVHQSLRKAGNTRYPKEAIQRLSQALIPDEVGQYQRLVIVADGDLHDLPFAVLHHPEDPKTPLLLSHIISYQSGLSLLRTKIEPRLSPTRVVVLADPVFPTNPRTGLPYPALPGTRREAEHLVRLLGENHVDISLGTAATISRLKSDAVQKATHLHLATHGLVDESQPILSGLVLSAEEDQDGFLGLYDLWSLELKAQLVFLGACHGADGKLVKGEGLVGLVRGFQEAGAQRVAAGLWQVGDRPTALLTERFYEALFRDGLPAAEALTQAQRFLFRQPQWRAPHYWAAFKLHGDWR